MGITTLWYSDEASLLNDRGVTSLLQTRGIPLHEFPNGIADLVASTGGTVTSNPGGGIKYPAITSANLNDTITFNVPEFVLEAESHIILVWEDVVNPESSRATQMQLTTQALNFSSFIYGAPDGIINVNKVNVNGGPCVTYASGTKLNGTKTGTGVDIGTTIDRMKVSIVRSAGTEMVLKGVYLDTAYAPTLSIFFDDCNVSTYTYAFRYMAQKNLKGTVALITNQVGTGATHLTTRMLDEMYEAGWDIVSHSHNHYYFDKLVPSVINEQISTAQAVDANGYFVLNGSMGGALDTRRPITLYAVSACPALRMIITGVVNGVTVVEKVVGNGSALSTRPLGYNEWDSITSIQCLDATTGNCSIGVAMSYQEAYNEILASKNWLIAHGYLRGINIFVAPGGAMTIASDRALRDLDYEFNRTVSPVFDFPHLCPAKMNISSIGSGAIPSGNSATVITNIDKVIASRAPATIQWHEIIPSADTPAGQQSKYSDFQLVIDHVATKVNARELNAFTITQHVEALGY